ncbi:MAG: TIGR03936 family radical SAM-associated protein [Eubacteriales bacterium]|nr:TIGR03936 family radical SAM-associated protein [Eubacteriales bacterium]
MRLIARLTKGERVRFVSHLDIQRLLQRAFRRADIPLSYSQGFNPHPQLSFATALSTGYTSDAEWVDVKLDKNMEAGDFLDKVNHVMPEGFALAECYAVEDKLPSLTALLESADYELTFANDTDYERLKADIDKLVNGEIIVDKKTKGGIKNVNIRPQLINAELKNGAEGIKLYIKGALTASGSLNIELLMGALARQSGREYDYGVHRSKVEFIGGRNTPV